MADNLRCAGVKRLLKEAKELATPNSLFHASPLEDNLFEWHFSFRGPPDTDFDGGIYHGRIVLPNEYPMKPPNLMILTENGRFEVNTKICLSISGHHPESWIPSWSIRTAILALIAFFPTDGNGALGSIECSSEVRKKLAKKSLDYNCSTCGCSMRTVLPDKDDAKQDNIAEDGCSTSSATNSQDSSSTVSQISLSNNPIVSNNEVNSGEQSTQSNNTTVLVSSQRSTLLYGFCLVACFVAFIALLVRRLGSA